MFLAKNLTSSLMMQAVVYNGIPNQVSVVERPKPTLETDTDAIVQITIAGICGTDLHMYHGYRGQGDSWGMGHEALGRISEIGSGVSSLAVGDYVVIPDNVDSGHLDMAPPSFEVFGVGRGLEGLQGKLGMPRIQQTCWNGALIRDSGVCTCTIRRPQPYTCAIDSRNDQRFGRDGFHGLIRHLGDSMGGA